MSNEKRIEEVAGIIGGLIQSAPSNFYRKAIIVALSSLPEFQSPQKASADQICAFGDALSAIGKAVPLNWLRANLPVQPAPESTWVEFLDSGNRFCSGKHLFRFEDGSEYYGVYGHVHSKGLIQAVYSVPPYAPPESELVRRFRKKLLGSSYRCDEPTNTGTVMVEWLKEVEKEIADGK